MRLSSCLEAHFYQKNIKNLLSLKQKQPDRHFQNESKQAYHISRTQIFLEEFANLHSYSHQSGAILGRNNLDVYHIGKNSTSVVDGTYLCSKNQVIDNHTKIDHVVGDCQSSQLYKGIIQDQARAVFNGQVVIRHGSQKASSEQLNKNLLLSSEAEVDSKPELAIYADDVKATHGSTIGQLNEEEIFYFESRAISRAKAIQLLSKGFIFEVAIKFAHPTILKWLQKNLEQIVKDQNV